MCPYPATGSPARDAAGLAEPAGRYPGRWGDDGGGRWKGNRARVARAQPRRGRARRAGRPRRPRGSVPISSVRPHSVRAPRCPSPGTRDSRESGCGAHAHAARTSPSSRQASAKPPGGTDIAPVCSAVRSIRQSREPTLPAPQRWAGPHFWRDVGSPPRREGRAPWTARSAPPGCLGSAAPRARPRGVPPGRRG